VINFASSGSFTVGSAVSGSTSLQSITFDANSSQIQILALSPTTLENAFNSDCGQTSPYCTPAGSSCTNSGIAAGQSETSDHMFCQHYTFPSVLGSTIQNVASFSSGVLTLGAGTTGVPGVFSGPVPSTATIVYQ
jgi:hypothetical protein